MTDLEAVAKLVGITPAQADALIPWVLAGICIEKLAELGLQPELWAYPPPNNDWCCTVGRHDAYDVTAPAAIIACAAAVSRQRSGE